MTPQQPQYQQVPTPPTAKKGPSCWAIGGIGCVVVILLFAILAYVGYEKVINTKQGKEMIGSIQGMVSGAKAAVDCEAKLQQVDGALVRYHEKNGKFPSKLDELIPAYLPDATALKCALTDSDPTKSPFTYTPPTAKSVPTDKLLSFTWNQKMNTGSQSVLVETNYYFTVAGKEMVQQSTTDSTGRTTTMPAKEKVGASMAGN